MEVLDDVLGTLRARSACSTRMEASDRWGIEVMGSDEGRFYAVLEGTLFLKVADQDPVALGPGARALLPRGGAHALLDAPDSPPRPLSEAVAGRTSLCGEPFAIGASSPRVRIALLHVAFEDARQNPLLAALPPLLVGQAGEQGDWLDPVLRLLDRERQAVRSGASTMVARLAELSFIQMVREHVATLEPAQVGWLSALGDPQIGAALSLVHENPENAWTVRELALRVAMSRSAFAARFTRLVGEPPLHYVTRWRMHRAASMLRDSRRSIAEIASSVGYDSEAAFSKAFKRTQGSAPGAYRRAARSSYPAAA